MLTITEAAQTKITDLLLEENNPTMRLRMYVQGGGCSGFSHGFSLDEVMNEDDFSLCIGGVPILIDSISAHYLTGATVDYKEDINGSNFTMDIQGTTGKCGCGSSFSM